MVYISEEHLNQMTTHWEELIDVIEESIKCLCKNQYSQPIKPYLRYGDTINRIIAMPAYVGGNFEISGIKWISSFPKNKTIGLPRAHSVTILNDATTGKPISIIHSAQVSMLRTAAVSGYMIRKFISLYNLKNISVGIIGLGPIGCKHLEMCETLFGSYISKYLLYDTNISQLSDVSLDIRKKIHFVSNWQNAYSKSNIVITCTNTSERYINIPPVSNSLLINVSLRDYKLEIYDYVKDNIIVDDWDEVCRENTDIETFFKFKGLKKENVYLLKDVFNDKTFSNLKNNKPIMFNPMGMAVFDVAVGYYIMKKLTKTNKFINLI